MDRRSLISVVLCCLWLLPPFAAMHGRELPACCRREGAHHCAMMSQAMAASSASDDDASDDGVPEQTLRSHETCPYGTLAQLSPVQVGVAVERAQIARVDAAQAATAAAHQPVSVVFVAAFSGRAPPAQV